MPWAETEPSSSVRGALSADGRMRVVQDRAVPLAGRWEFAPEISGTIGGDAYNLTTNLALNAQRHFNPLLSGGLKLEQSFNSLSAEGESVVGEARAQGQGAVPDIDYPKRHVHGDRQRLPALWKTKFV